MSKPESKLARRRRIAARIAARIDDLEGEARMFDRWAAGRREESAALMAKLAELEGKPLVWDFSPMGECPDCKARTQLPQQRGKEPIHGLPY